MNIDQTKKDKNSIPIVTETYFSEVKLTKSFGNALSKRTTTPLLTNLPISERFFHDSPLCPNFKNKETLLILGLAETM